MAMSKSSYNYNRVTWEDSEFPILCQTCLGDNPYLRMMKEKFGRECKICNRPFTTFRWCPGRGMRYKKTEVCQTCAKLKNVCQTCLLDLEYGLPVQVRDYAMQLKSDELPRHGSNRDFYIQNIEKEMSQTDGTTPGGAVGRMIEGQGPSDLLMKLARSQPYYDRNRPHICSFWVKGECKRGEECPYRHEKPSDPDDPLSDQNMKDRYYGSKDPVADKLLNRARAMPQLRPPEDRSITTLYVGNLGEDGFIDEKDLRNYFYQFGEVRNITLLPGKGCGFIQFTTRNSAEMAAEKAFNKLIIKGRRLTIRWGRPQSQQTAAPGEEGEGTKRSLNPVPGIPGALPPPPVDFFNLGGGAGIPLPEGGPSTAKKARPSGDAPSTSSGASQFVPRIPMPGIAPLFNVQSVPFVGSAKPTGTGAPPKPPTGTRPRGPPPSGGIHYPSQDPQHLGAKDLRD